jgi:small subunit ribosomal protein S1
VSSEEKPESFASLLAESSTNDGRRTSTRVGAKIDVVVTQIGKTDVFVSLGAKQEGFIERANLIDKDGKLTVEVGSRITARVVESAGRTGAVRLEPLVVRSPHDDLAQAAPQVEGPVLAEGLKVKGKVARVERYGVFVQIDGTQGRKGRGLIPVTETGTPRGADLVKHFPIDAEVESKIVKIEEDGKIRLSISALKVDEERSQFEAFAKDARGPKAPASNPKEPPPRKVGTLGLLLQQKLSKKLDPYPQRVPQRLEAPDPRHRGRVLDAAPCRQVPLPQLVQHVLGLPQADRERQRSHRAGQGLQALDAGQVVRCLVQPLRLPPQGQPRRALQRRDIERRPQQPRLRHQRTRLAVAACGEGLPQGRVECDGGQGLKGPRER